MVNEMKTPYEIANGFRTLDIIYLTLMCNMAANQMATDDFEEYGRYVTAHTLAIDRATFLDNYKGTGEALESVMRDSLKLLRDEAYDIKNYILPEYNDMMEALGQDAYCEEQIHVPDFSGKPGCV